MKKQILLLVLMLLPVVAKAYDAQIDGIYYNFSGDEATVTYQKYLGGHYSDYSGSVVIPSTVTYNGKTYTVTSIGEWAFYGCGRLTSITIPNSVTDIGENAFVRCSNLTSVTIPNSVTNIDGHAFSNCTSLTSITIPNSVITIDDYAFFQCASMTSITIPNSVTTIGSGAFGETAWYNNEPDGLVYAGKVAYRYKGTMPDGTQIVLKDGTLGIAGGAFSECSGLTSITIPNSVTSIGNGAFHSCSSLTSVTIGNSVTSIVSDAFSGCSSLTSIIIPNSVTSIGFAAFYECVDLTSISIPNSVTSIADHAFDSCNALTSLTIPNSVTSIGERAFYGCSSLTSVKVDIEVPITIIANTFSNRANATLTVPYGSKAAYEAAAYWQEFKEIVEDEMAEKDNITIGSTGYATYCSRYPLDFSEVSGMKAYIASGFSPSTGKLVLTNVTEVPAGEGLYLVGEAGTYGVAIAETDMLYSNLLKGVTSATTIYPTDGDYTNFILANGIHGVAFYNLSEAGELAAGKAYLQLPTASVSDVKAISVIFDDDNEDGISRPTPDPSRNGGEVYNLQGQQVSTPKSGLYIINGKKVFIK